MKGRIFGPTYEEMLYPWKVDEKIKRDVAKIASDDPLNPLHLFNISWRNRDKSFKYFMLPPALTGVKANILILYAKDFPSGSHKVGPTYSVLMEEVLEKNVDVNQHVLVWPSTGNYGVGGAWVSSRMSYNSMVILPEAMSQERFDLIRFYGSDVIATKGCESNVKEIYDKAKELKKAQPEKFRILNQFENFANYRFHYHVTGNTMLDLVKEEKIGDGRIASVVLTVGSAGTIASGDRIKEAFPELKIVAGEPVQCPTLSLNGYGDHDIQGIGDKHVTWIHNVMNLDGVVQIDDMDAKTLLKVFTSEPGKNYLKTLGDPEMVDYLSDKLGISGCANIIAAIKTAKFYNFKEGQNIITVATDAIDRYHSVMKNMPTLTEHSAKSAYERIVFYQEPSLFYEASKENRLRWHNLKYYTWIEQQDKAIETLNLMQDQVFWKKEAKKVHKIEAAIKAWREDYV